MRLSGYRDTDRDLLHGHWLRGELLGLPLGPRPALAEPVSVPPPGGRGDERLYVIRDTAFVRITGIDWIARRGRLETGLREEAAADAKTVLAQAVAHAFDVLGLRRVHGTFTPLAGASTEPLEAAGFVREARWPQALWHDGGTVDREVWGVLRDV
ncbi:GNAT family N-acetyltransferase [Actinacidiphila sp. ITFR-21]|uniref:GNAT family N-acetyltransferase n=1 Tax=Actinacidiphila sp. ITFR-21 TaxID=3075199 RepID=UPI00288A3463|nr:GNAT family protein [Streptomyces sp. ITFR-21]WNI18960.1 GNAT family protein [Streptomyces sp. ITFR-21]